VSSVFEDNTESQLLRENDAIQRLNNGNWSEQPRQSPQKGILITKGMHFSSPEKAAGTCGPGGLHIIPR
jgi:hypothetical protein